MENDLTILQCSSFHHSRTPDLLIFAGRFWLSCNPYAFVKASQKYQVCARCLIIYIIRNEYPEAAVHYPRD